MREGNRACAGWRGLEGMMKKRITLVLILCVVMIMAASCGSGPVGYWQISEFTTGDTVMTEADVETYGLASLGAVKLQKSGNCVIDIMGAETEGTWYQTSDGTIEINANDGSMTMSGAINDDGVMTLTDNAGAEY
jgi:hypothetical protein